MSNKILLLLLLLVCTPSWADSNLSIPDIGNPSDAVLSLKEELKIGDQFMRNARRSGQLITDPEVNAYVQALGSRLVSYLDNVEHDYTFFVVNSATINAFAVPGGYIGINAGLIMAAENESELASVLAHEIAHVSQRHISRSIEKSGGSNLTTIAAVLAAIALSGQDGDASFAALSLGMANDIQSRINFTRTHEKEADRIGIQLLAHANYDPSGMARFFEKLHQESRYYEQGLPEILMTHPVTLNRIAEAKDRIAQLNKQGIVDQPAFQIIRAKVQVLNSNNNQQLAQHTLAHYQKHPSPALDYQLALLETLNNAPKQAEERLQKLIKEQGMRPWFTIALADSLVAQARYDEARQHYQSALQIYTGNPGLTLNYGGLLLNLKRYQECVQLLREYLRNNPTASPGAYHLYAQAQDKLGNPIESFSAIAEYFYLNGQSTVAIQHLESARKYAEDDPYQLPAIELRLEQVKAIALEEQQH